MRPARAHRSAAAPPRRRARTSLRRALAAGPALAFLCCAYVYLTLPDVRPLRHTRPATTAFIELRKQEAVAANRRFAIRQQWVGYPAISGHLRRAVLVAEDAAFFEHDGIDLRELRASLEANWEDGRFTRGASTITQQLAKNLYLSPSRNPIRKLSELFITRRLEAELSKRRILELYLNLIEWGDGIFGAEAAAQAYFGKAAAALSVDEAALLAGAIINPREHSPARPTARLRRRQGIIVRRMGVRPASALPAAAQPALPREVTPSPERPPLLQDTAPEKAPANRTPSVSLGAAQTVQFPSHRGVVTPSPTAKLRP